MRVGFVSAPQPFIDAIVLHVSPHLTRSSSSDSPPTPVARVQTMNSNLQPPTFTQVLSLRMLKFWGYEKLRAHVDRVAEFYRTKRDVFEGLMQKYLSGLAEWNIPEAGMFFWYVSL